MEEDIKKIILAGVRAPSGDNSQPWRFEISENILRCFNLPEKDNPLFNYKQRGSHIAHGALIENIVIASEEIGLKTNIKLFPDSTSPNLVSEISFEASTPKSSHLFNAIFERAINRKKYNNKSLDIKQRKTILEAPKVVGCDENIFVKLVVDNRLKEKIGKASSTNEVVMLENEVLHGLFFNDVRWSEESEKKFKNGLYVKTMELKPPQIVVFKLMSFWPLAKILNKLGIARFIARENAKIYRTGAAFGVVCIKKNGTPSDFVNAGRVMQRIWLESWVLKMGFHPITGIVYLVQKVLDGTNTVFNKKHSQIIREAYDSIVEAFELTEEIIAAPFRIGYADRPSGMSSRLEPQIQIVKKNL